MALEKKKAPGAKQLKPGVKVGTGGGTVGGYTERFA